MDGQKKKQKRGFPIKDFGNDGGRGLRWDFPQVRHPGNLRAVFSLLLNVSITPCSSPRQSSSRGPWYLKNQRRRNLDSRLKISGMTKEASLLNASIIPLSVIPECLYQKSKLFKGEDIWIPAW